MKQSGMKHHVLLTGVTGFVGKVVLWQLMTQREELGIGKVSVLIRSKSGSARGGKKAAAAKSEAGAKKPAGHDSAGTPRTPICKARYFVPSLGINEDPATGSFAGPLAWQLMREGRLAAGETLRIEQGAEVKRPSTLFARVSADPEPRVEVGGSARVVARGQFVV